MMTTTATTTMCRVKDKSQSEFLKSRDAKKGIIRYPYTHFSLWNQPSKVCNNNTVDGFQPP